MLSTKGSSSRNIFFVSFCFLAVLILSLHMSGWNVYVSSPSENSCIGIQISKFNDETAHSESFGIVVPAKKDGPMFFRFPLVPFEYAR